MSTTPATASNIEPEKPKWRVPHTYVLIFLFIVVAAIATYFIPAGAYDRVKDAHTGRMLVNPASFHYIKAKPIEFFDVFMAIPKGIRETSIIMAFLFIIGGAFSVIEKTGMLEAGVFRAVKYFKGREKLMIPASMALFSVGGFCFGMAEETIIFVPIGVAIARSLGYDNIVGTAMISTGAAAGFSSGMLNPFSVGVAHSIAELPMFSGMQLRIAAYVFVLGSAILYTMWYAARVKKDLTKSYMYDLLDNTAAAKDVDMSSVPEFTTRHKLVLLTVAVCFGVIIYAIIYKDWGMAQMAAMFLIMGIVTGIVGGLKADDIANEFVRGAKTLTFGALLVGLARAITIVLTDAKVIDTIVYGMAQLLSGFPMAISAIGMSVLQSLLNFIIPSSSGMAATTLPILIPLGDVIGLTRQTTVLAFQFGDGFTNSIVPTSAALMGYLAVAGIPYERWVRFIGPLIGIWIVIGCIFVTIAVSIKYGPF